MPYPIVNDADARAWWKVWAEADAAAAPPEPLEADTAPDGSEIDWPRIVVGVISQLEELYDRVDGRIEPTHSFGERFVGGAGGTKKEDKMTNDRFEARACVKIHESLPTDDALADPNFWIWMATVPGLELIRRRYAGKNGAPRVPDRLNFTSSSARETFFYRLWLRAELCLDKTKSNPYELANYGDVDFWRSHVFRQMSTETEPLLAAFIELQHPNGAEGDKRMTQAEIRQLVKYMRRCAANVVVETLDKDGAKEFVEEQWRKVQASKHAEEA